MTEEDRTSAKLKGYNCLVKFKDGEALLLKVPDLNNEEDTSCWFTDVEQFLNGTQDVFPAGSIALVRDTIKYIKQI